MDLSPAEEVVIGLLRGEQAVDFTMNIAWIGPVWTVALTTEGDGILAGRGDTFRQAIRVAFGIEGDPGGGEEVEPAPRPALRIVGGSGHHPDAVECRATIKMTAARQSG